MAATNKFYCFPEDGEESMPCPYNYSHVVPASMHSFHVRHCPQKNNEGQSSGRRRDKASSRGQKDEDWEPDIVPGRPGYVPLMSSVRPFFREVHSMTHVQRRRYYDEMLKQHKVVNMLKSLANKSCFGQQRRNHTMPNQGQVLGHPLHIPTKQSTADLDEWYIEPMITSLSSRLESILLGAERQPTSSSKYFCDVSRPKMKLPGSSLPEATNHPPILPEAPRDSQCGEPDDGTVTAERRKSASVPSTTSSLTTEDSVSSVEGDSSESKRISAADNKMQTTALRMQRSGTNARNTAVVSLRRINRETAEWVRAGDPDDEPFYCSGKGRGRVRV